MQLAKFVSLLLFSLSCLHDVAEAVSGKRKKDEAEKNDPDSNKRKRTYDAEWAKAYYQRKKEARERGDEEAIAWFERKAKARQEYGKGLTDRISTNTSSEKDVERYHKRLESMKQYEQRRFQRTGIKRKSDLKYYREHYHRRKKEKEEGDEESKKWFEDRNAQRRKSDKEFMERIKNKTYTEADMERYQKRKAQKAKYREQKRQKVQKDDAVKEQ